MPSQIFAINETFGRWLEAIRERVPGVNIRLEAPPISKDGVWFADIDLNLRTVVIQYSEAKGFGVSSMHAYSGFIAHPEHVFQGADVAADKVQALLCD